MRRVILLTYTGPTAVNLVVAKRMVRKIRAAIGQRECLLVDCEHVDVAHSFLLALVSAARPEKIRFCGLTLLQQQFVQSQLQRRNA